MSSTDATDTITIQGHDFSVPLRYAEGYQLKANEAKALNQTLHENLRNNFAGKVKAAKETHGDELSEDAVDALQKELDQYAAEYEFNVRTGGGGRAPADPVEAEAVRQARGLIRAAIKQGGGNVKDYDDESLDAAVEQLLNDDPSIREAAAVIVEQKKAIAGKKISLPAKAA